MFKITGVWAPFPRLPVMYCIPRLAASVLVGECTWMYCDVAEDGAGEEW